MNQDPEQPNYKIGEVDCASKFGAKVCQDLNVENTPTNLLFPAGEEPIICRYTGDKFMQGALEYWMQEGWKSDKNCDRVPESLLPKKSKSNKKAKKDKKKKK